MQQISPLKTHWGWRGQQSALIQIIGFPDPTPTCHLTVVSVQIHLLFLHENELWWHIYCKDCKDLLHLRLPIFSCFIIYSAPQISFIFCFSLSLLATSFVGHPAHEAGIFKKKERHFAVLVQYNVRCFEEHDLRWQDLKNNKKWVTSQGRTCTSLPKPPGTVSRQNECFLICRNRSV